MPSHSINPSAGALKLKKIRRRLLKENAYQRLLRVVTAVANESVGTDEPLRITLDEVCALTRWPIGHALLKAADRDELLSARIWHFRRENEFPNFRVVSEGITFGPGVGLPGRVLTTGEPVWISDGSKDANLPRNRLMQAVGLKAAFAFPILVRREVVGVLEFFHTEAIVQNKELLEVMYQVGVQLGRVIERRRSEQTLMNVVQGIVPKQGADLLESLVAVLAKNIKADYVLIGETMDDREAVRTTSVYGRGRILPNFVYELAGTPCENVVSRTFCSYPRGVRARFPHDHMLKDMGVDAYMGTPLFDAKGRVLGLLAALWAQAPADPHVAESMVQIFAARAAAELERRKVVATAAKLAAVGRASPHPILEFSGNGVMRYCNGATHLLAKSLGKGDPLDILPSDTQGVVRQALSTGQNGLVVDTLPDGRTIIWSFIPIMKSNSVFAHAFELTLFINLHEELRRSGGVSRDADDAAQTKSDLDPLSVRPKRGKETIH